MIWNMIIETRGIRSIKVESKGRIGDCFSVDCCEWIQREVDDICGLNDKRITADEKIKELFEYSVLKDSFAKAGL